MGRIRKDIDIRNRKCWTLFDSSARNSYVTTDVAIRLHTEPLPMERTAAIGGDRHKISNACLVVGQVEGNWVEFNASVIDEIGKDEDGREIDVLMGAIAMQLWGIKLDLPNEELDLSHFTKDFVEYAQDPCRLARQVNKVERLEHEGRESSDPYRLARQVNQVETLPAQPSSPATQGGRGRVRLGVTQSNHSTFRSCHTRWQGAALESLTHNHEATS